MGSQELRNSDGRRTDRYGVCTSLTSLPQVIPLANDDCVTIDLIWGVVDTVFETNFPDIRNRCAIHSENGSAMVIPREGDKVRLYIQLSDKQVVDPATGRVDKNRVSPDHIIQVETLSHILAAAGHLVLIRRQPRRLSDPTQSPPERSTGGQFISVRLPLLRIVTSPLSTVGRSWSTSRVQVFRPRTGFHRR